MPTWSSTGNGGGTGETEGPADTFAFACGGEAMHGDDAFERGGSGEAGAASHFALGAAGSSVGNGGISAPAEYGPADTFAFERGGDAIHGESGVFGGETAESFGAAPVDALGGGTESTPWVGVLGSCSGGGGAGVGKELVFRFGVLISLGQGRVGFGLFLAYLSLHHVHASAS